MAQHTDSGECPRYNRPMSGARWRRYAVLGLVLLPMPLLVLAVLPGGSAAVQVAGIALAWWYGVLVGPVVATVLATTILIVGGE
jgi:hypothetical protein